MSNVYSYSNLNREVDENFQGRTTNLLNRRAILNRAVRRVALDIDLRSTKRSVQLSPSLFRNVYQYTAPADLKGLGIIDLQRQIKRSAEFVLTTAEEFDRQKTLHNNILARYDADFLTYLLVAGDLDETRQNIHQMDSITNNGTWAVVSGTAAGNITLDTNNFIQGSGALNWDVDTEQTTASIENSDMTSLDLTTYRDGGSLFVWQFIPSTTNISNFILRWGSSSTVFHARTITATNEGLSFFVGWNLLRFDWDNSVADTGTPDDTAINHVRLIMTLSAVLTNADTDFRTDFIVARKGDIHNFIYYSRFLWQTSSGTYIENSTVDGDLLNVETEEYDLIVEKANELVARALQEREDKTDAMESYREQKKTYELASPSERKVLTTSYEDLESLGGSPPPKDDNVST